MHEMFFIAKTYRLKVVVRASPSLPSDLSDGINNLYLALAEMFCIIKMDISATKNAEIFCHKRHSK